MFGLQSNHGASQVPHKYMDTANLLGPQNNNYSFNNNMGVNATRGAGNQKMYHQGLMNTHKDVTQWRRDSLNQQSVAQMQDRVLPVSI